MSLIDIYKKQGGLKLIKQYVKSGSLGTAIGEFILLGHSRTALEILRLSTQLKVKTKLEKKYKKKLKKFDMTYDNQLEHVSSNKVWVCWFQGIEQAPLLVRKCYESVKKNLINKDVILITAENIRKYVDFPEYILKKWENGEITHTHMTDLLRLELLIKYGGMWIDATVFCTEKEEDIPKYFFDSDLFFYQSLKPGRDGHCSYISSWLMSAKTNNKVLMATRYLCYEYWKENNDMMDYFLLHDFMSIVLEYYPNEWNHIVPRDNATPHILLLRLFERYDSVVWDAIKKQTPFHKLSYKASDEKFKIKDSYYDIILKGEKDYESIS